MARSLRVTTRSLLFFFLTLTLVLSPGLAAPALALRVVSLYPGHSDNVVALGGAESLVGLSENDDPDLLPNLPRFSKETGAEAILALSPDVVLMRGLTQRANPGLADVLQRAGVRVESIDPPSWDGFADYLRTLAGILGLDPESGVERLDATRAAIRQEAASRREAAGGRAPRVFLEATARELHTCAPGSWAAHLIELAGGENAARGAEPIREGSALAPWGLERVLKLLEDGLDVYLVQQGAMNASTLEAVRARPWAGALERTRLAAMPERLLSRPSLLGLERGGRLLMDVLYGEAAQ